MRPFAEGLVISAADAPTGIVRIITRDSRSARAFVRFLILKKFLSKNSRFSKLQILGKMV